MNHVDEYEDIDREASLWATAALESKELPNGFTIEELCYAVKWPLPVSDEDLFDLARMCKTWGVKINLNDELSWLKKDIKKEMDPMRAAQLEREDKFDAEMDRQREEDER